MSQQTITNCPICSHPECTEYNTRALGGGGTYEGMMYNCPTCNIFLFADKNEGPGGFSSRVASVIPKLNDAEKGRLSRVLFQKSLPLIKNWEGSSGTELVVFKEINPLLQDPCSINHEKAWKRFISHSEILDDLLLFLYDEYQKTNSIYIHPKSEHLNAISGGILTVGSSNSIEYVHNATIPYFKKMIEQGWITDTQLIQPIINVTMTFDGLLQCEKIKEGKGNSRQLFVALQFNSKFAKFYEEHLKPHFDIEGVHLPLIDLKEKQKANSLPDQIEAEIRQSVAIIADVSTHNCNVFWEAGFAHGLKKPIIYFYNKAEVPAEVPKNKELPFDIRHRLYIPWGINDNEETICPKSTAEHLAAVLNHEGILSNEQYNLVKQSINEARSNP
jgi:hypothetical protein